jgi:hypothetical protein
MIKFLNREDIHSVKWDACNESSASNLIYGLSWYLDTVAPDWGGLIEDDYVSVMPLPLRKRYGFQYVYHPPYTQQLGVFAKTKTDAHHIHMYLDANPSFVKLADFNLNWTNNIKGLENKTETRNNYVLDLSSSYSDLEKKFSANTRRNIQKSFIECKISKEIELNDLLNLKRDNSPHIKKNTFHDLMKKLALNILEHDKGFIVGAKKDGAFIAAAFIAVSGKRFYYLIPVSNEIGKKSSAMFGILDHVISENAETGFALDFEGSNIPGIARFFEGFGAELIPYHYLNLNRLPSWMRFLKK